MRPAGDEQLSRLARRSLLLGAAAGLLLPRRARADTRGRVDRRGTLPGVVPAIDWSNPLTVGLVAAYVTPSSGNVIRNLVGLGGDLVLGSGGQWGSTPEGRGLDHSNSNGQAQVSTPAVLQLAKRQSLFWRGVLGSTPAADTGIFEASFTTTDTTPFNAYCLLYLSTGQISGGANNGTTLTLASATPANVGRITSLGMTSDQIASGNVLLYERGAQVASASIGTGTSTTYSSSLLALGGYPPVTTRTAPNTRSLCGFIWNRVLSAADMLALHFDPYQFLRFSDDPSPEPPR